MRTPAELTNSRKNAALVRAQWLAAYASGLVSTNDLLEFAATDDGAALRRILLRELAGDKPGPVLRRLRIETGTGPEVRLNVRWLVDHRARNRFSAWKQSLANPDSPWLGWPLRPPPGNKEVLS